MDKIETIIKMIIPTADFSSNKKLIGQNRLDSIDRIRLVTELESTFQISIPPEDMLPENFEDLPAIERLVKTIQDRATN